VASSTIIDILCRDMGKMFHYLEYKNKIKIDLVEDERAHVNQFFLYNKEGEEITDLFKFS
jgi:ribonuclease G